MSLDALRAAITKLEKALTLFEAYEKPMYAFECLKATEGAMDLLAALADVTAAEPGGLVDFHHARAQAEETRLQVAAFTPHSQSSSIRHLRQRQQVVNHLRSLITAATSTLTTCTDERRPAYLQLVTEAVPASIWNRAARNYAIRQAARRRRPRRLYRKGRHIS